MRRNKSPNCPERCELASSTPLKTKRKNFGGILGYRQATPDGVSESAASDKVDRKSLRQSVPHSFNFDLGAMGTGTSGSQSRATFLCLVNDGRGDEDDEFGAAFVIEDTTKEVAEDRNVAKDGYLALCFVMLVLDEAADHNRGTFANANE